MSDQINNLITYRPVPGRGLVIASAIQLRLDYLRDKGFELRHLNELGFPYTSVQNNIESLVGSVAIPVGLIGPILYEGEEVHAVAGTLEGALIASINRGAKAISLAGGVNAKVYRQRMVRAPLFIMANATEAQQLESWVLKSFEAIKKVAEEYSNHAVLLELDPERDGESLHLRFVYTTGDAAGQNMTTTCTWHALLWINAQFEKETNVAVTNFLLEGNASSDKKVSQYLIDKGRGVKVSASVTIPEKVIRKVLRTDIDQLLRFIPTSKRVAKANGMLAYNINVANAVAAIFVATGQDLASIHESSLGDLDFEKTEEGLVVKLTLYSLVIGTVGGGTQLAKQQEALQLMGCSGSGKIARFAALIAGFALGLELSTHAALASGEFAKAHEKLGRNKPVDWLQLQELNTEFISPFIQANLSHPIQHIQLLDRQVENGVLTHISKKVNRKIMGFTALDVQDNHGTVHPLLMKSKPLDIEVIKGLHIMAASIDPQLSDLISTFRRNLEYNKSHLKELRIAAYLNEVNFDFMPRYFGQIENPNREIYALFMERLDLDKVQIVDSENRPEEWTSTHVIAVVDALNLAQVILTNHTNPSALGLSEFDLKKSEPLYRKMIELVCADADDTRFNILHTFLDDLCQHSANTKVLKMIVHNDFNPKNVGIRLNNTPFIYDWELAVINYPQRDLVEFLAFVLPTKFDKQTLIKYLRHQYDLATNEVTWEDWVSVATNMTKEFLVTRLSFYKTAEIVMKLKFVDRVFQNAIRMIDFLDDK
ncbi:MAG: hydroxymethylglutaryl-CoA reductase (NADPH) [Crocinitomix sp.]|jgi:hydroxymethylglutaryl-CoA reductase (NADPH)